MAERTMDKASAQTAMPPFFREVPESCGSGQVFKGGVLAVSVAELFRQCIDFRHAPVTEVLAEDARGMEPVVHFPSLPPSLPPSLFMPAFASHVQRMTT